MVFPVVFPNAPDIKRLSYNDLIIYDEIRHIERKIYQTALSGYFAVDIQDSQMTAIDYIPDVPATTVVTMKAILANLFDGGSGYTANDILTAIGGTSIGLTYQLSSIFVVNGGTGYAINDVITINGGTYTTAIQLTVTAVGVGGVITNASITVAGNYTVKPNNAVSTTKISGLGDNAATFNLNWIALTTDKIKIKVLTVNLSGVIQTWSIEERGEYDSLITNAVSFTGGTGTSAKFNIDWGVKNVYVVNAGSGYKLPPDVIFSSGTAQAVAAPLNGNMLTNIAVTNSGSAYTTIPTVTLDPRGLAEEYYDVWKMIKTDRVRQDQMKQVIDYFEKKNFTIQRVTNPVTENQTFFWHLSW